MASAMQSVTNQYPERKKSGGFDSVVIEPVCHLLMHCGRAVKTLHVRASYLCHVIEHWPKHASHQSNQCPFAADVHYYLLWRASSNMGGLMVTPLSH